MTAPLRLADILGALSYALDLAEGQPPGHCLRACWIGMRIGAEHGLSTDQLWQLYYTLLLKDAGCSSNAARLCELYGSDDLVTKRDVKTVDLQSKTQLLRFVISHTGIDKSLWQRLKLALHLVRHGERLATEVVAARCERGADIARRLGFGEPVAAGIQSLDEHWNGRGRPAGSAGDAIPVASRIALLAQVVDVFHHNAGVAAAVAEVQARSGAWFDPALAAIVGDLRGDDAFWRRLDSPDLAAAVAALEPGAVDIALDDDRLDAIAAA